MIYIISENMNIIEKDGVTYLEFKSLKKYSFIKQATSTRLGGLSSKEGLKWLNLGTHTSDTAENVKQNYEIFCRAADFDVKKLVLGNQTHSTNVRYATFDDCGKGIYSDRDYNDVDALVTDNRGLTLVIHTADCVPVLLVDTKKHVIGAAHCGWRGTFGELARVTIDEMKKRFSTCPEDVVCTIGPAICQGCYEVSRDLFLRFREKFGSGDALKEWDNSFCIDLSLINRQILAECGVNKENIYISDLCTACNKDLLYSHRGQGPQRGIFASFLQLV